MLGVGLAFGLNITRVRLVIVITRTIFVNPLKLRG